MGAGGIRGNLAHVDQFSAACHILGDYELERGKKDVRALRLHRSTPQIHFS